VTVGGVRALHERLIESRSFDTGAVYLRYRADAA
jgi:hypothetical protein